MENLSKLVKHNEIGCNKQKCLLQEGCLVQSTPVKIPELCSDAHYFEKQSS